MPSTVYILDWLNLVLRWAHIITGIAWIGSSFYFVWLDTRLNVPPHDPENDDVAGDLWAVHGGGFYHAQKYKTAPGELPEPLHWFKWEAYFTWLTGFALLIVVYYLNADAFLIDPAVADLSPAAAVGISIGLLAAGWIVYSGLCALKMSETVFTVVAGAALLVLCWALSLVFGGRGLYIQVGAMLGTVMVANVFRVIIPSQKQLVAAKVAGRDPDAALGERARRRSVHNNYLTLPVVFVMISPHFAVTYTHAWNWAVLFAVFFIGALVRHYFNLRNRGRHVIALPVAALLLLVLLAGLIAPRGGAGPGGTVSFNDVRSVIHERCVACHAADPTHPTAPVTAAGLALDTDRDIAAWSEKIYERAVVTKTMPLANLTGITEEERELLSRWYAAGAPVD